MSHPDPSSRTMRIDIPPSELPPPPQPTRSAWRVPLSTFVLRRHAKPLRNTPYDLLLESVYDGVLVTNAAGVVIDFNQRAADMFALHDRRLLDRPVVGLLSGADASLIASIWKNLETHRYTVVEASCVRAGNHPFPAEIAVNQLDVSGERVLCFFVRDITARKRPNVPRGNRGEPTRRERRARAVLFRARCALIFRPRNCHRPRNPRGRRGASR